MIKRIIARIDIKNNFLVKGMHLEGLRILGYPEFFSKKYFEEDIDEIIFQDVVASLYKRNQLSEITSKVSKDVFVPLIVGGGIRSIKDIENSLINGADRVSINTGGVNNKKFIKEAVNIFGSSTINITIETLNINGNYKVFTDSGRTETNIDAFEWVKEVEDYGVGEIILTSINNEGTGKGYDLKLFEKISNKLSIPLLAHGGARNPDDVYKLLNDTNVDGAVIASAFHFNYFKKIYEKKKIEQSGSTNFLNFSEKKNFSINIKDLKKYLINKKIDIRSL